MAAAHVQRAVAPRPVQPKPALPANRPPAPHVQAAVQLKPAPARSGPAPHVQAAVRHAPQGASALQPKPAGPPQTARTPAAPVRPGGVVQRKSEFSHHIVRQIVGYAASKSGLLDRVPRSMFWIMKLEDLFFTETILPKNDTSEARRALSWLTAQILDEDYPKCGVAVPFLVRVLKELRKLEQEGTFDQTALRSFAVRVAKLRSEASRTVFERRFEDISEESDSSDEDESPFKNNLKLKKAFEGKRTFRRRGSFSYSASGESFYIPGTQNQIDLHKKIHSLGQHSFRGNRVKVRLGLFWVDKGKLETATLSDTLSEGTTFRSADYLNKEEQEDLIPKVRSLLRTVGNPYDKQQMGTLLHSERDLVVKMDQIQDFAGKVRKEILTKAPKGSKLLILALDVHSCKNKVCSRCDSVLRALSRGGWKKDISDNLKGYDISDFRIIVRAGSDEGGGEEVNRLTRDKENTLETFTPDTLPSIIDIQPLDRMKHFPELTEFSKQFK